MTDIGMLKGTKILLVDDEPDILEVVKEELSEYDLTTADSFESAKRLITAEDFDLVVLDLMGVNGFDLLEECRKRKLPAAILTAHSLTVESLNRSIRLGAVSFIPKEELAKLPVLVAEIIEGLEQGQSHWHRLFKRLGPFFRDRLGVVWEDLEKPPQPPYFY